MNHYCAEMQCVDWSLPCVNGSLLCVNVCLVCVSVLCASLCNTLQHTAILERGSTSAREWAHTLQHTITAHCNTLQHTATHCNTLQHTAPHCNTLQHTIIAHCRAPQHTATHCNTLQHASVEAREPASGRTHCNTRGLHTAIHCNTLQHTATHTSTSARARAHNSDFACETETQSERATENASLEYIGLFLCLNIYIFGALVGLFCVSLFVLCTDGAVERASDRASILRACRSLLCLKRVH